MCRRTIRRLSMDRQRIRITPTLTPVTIPEWAWRGVQASHSARIGVATGEIATGATATSTSTTTTILTEITMSIAVIAIVLITGRPAAAEESGNTIRVIAETRPTEIEE